MTDNKVMGGKKLMFVYVADADEARRISRTKALNPVVREQTGILPFAYSKPHVMLTDVKPEEGRGVVAEAIGIDPKNINYGLEILVDEEQLRKTSEHHPRTYQVLSEGPVPVTVVALRDMDKIGRGYGIRRFKGLNGRPYGFYVPPETR